MAHLPKVLVLDDEAEIGQLLKLFLESDFDVETFTDPRELVKRVDDGNFDLLISDIKMPHLNGLEVTKIVHSKMPHIPVILITGHAQTAEDQEAAKKAGASQVLFKPFGEPAMMIDIVGKAIADAQSPNSKTSKKVIMVIDDESMLAEIITMLIGDHYEIDSYIDPRVAIVQVGSKPYCSVLTDLSMPGMNGLKVIQEIKKTHPKIPILVMTGHDQNSKEVQDAIRAGAVDMIPKPFPSSPELLELIGKYAT